MAGVVVLYFLIAEATPVFTGLLAVGFAVGAIIAVGSPTRWSVLTTLRLYQAVPMLVGVGAVVTGGYYLATTDVPVLGGIVLTWGVLALAVLARGPWDEVEAHLERLNARDSETDRDGAPLPIPRRRFLQLHYAGVGVLTVTAAVVLGRLLADPDLGQFAVLAGIGGAGIAHVACSPYSGPPKRVVRMRQARWIILGTGTAVSSLYGALVVDAALPAALWAAVTMGLVYWAAVRSSWNEVRDDIALVQEATESASG